jgi:hypothetical protein
MKRMTAAQVAATLRTMAERIEEDGIAVYRGLHPKWRGDWIANELVDGTLRHSAYELP